METPVRDLMDLLAIPGVSTEEQAVAAHVEALLRSLGVPASDIRYDRAFEQSEYGGKTGNLIVRLPGRGGHRGPARLFMAHLDSVALTRGAKARLAPAGQGRPRRIVNDNPDSALGADDRSGCAVLLHVARCLLAGDSPRPPLWLVFTVQEELGLIGARGLDLAALTPDPPAMAFNYDGGRVNRIITAVTGTTRFFIELYGRAAHSGINPQDGVSTAVAAATALARLAGDGWHGRIERDGRCGSANIGIMQGGQMTNTVMDRMSIRGEARSHDPEFRQAVVDRYRAAFERAAAETRNVAGQTARIDWSLGPCYESFSIADDAPVVQAARAAMRSAGLEPVTEINDGGMDANWVNARGLPMVTLGTGQHGAHTVGEWIDVDEFLSACRLAELIATWQP